MWEKPSPLAGYFTTCGNLNGDGTFAYRAASLPLTLDRLVLIAADHFRKPENRLYASGSLNGSNWESRHEISLATVKWLMHLPFVLFAVWLGGGLWWVARRLFGNEGGFLALALYTFCPAIIHFAVSPNNEVLAMWGLYGTVYTAMGVAHAMQGPRRKWRPRIVLLTLALGLASAAHLLAGMFGFLAILVFMFYLAERRRSAVMQIVIYSALGSLAILFAFFSFRPAPFSYVFTGGGGRFWFSLDGARTLLPRSRQLAHPCRSRRLAHPLAGLPPQPLLRQHRPAPDLPGHPPAYDDAGLLRTLAVGAPVPAHLRRRRLRGRLGDPSAQALPRPHRDAPHRPGHHLPHHASTPL